MIGIEIEDMVIARNSEWEVVGLDEKKDNRRSKKKAENILRSSSGKVKDLKLFLLKEVILNFLVKKEVTKLMKLLGRRTLMKAAKGANKGC